MKAGKKGKFQGNSKMVPGAPVGFRLGSLDMGGSLGKRHKKGGKSGSSGNGNKKKSEKLVIRGCAFGSPKLKDEKGVIESWLEEVI